MEEEKNNNDNKKVINNQNKKKEQKVVDEDEEEDPNLNTTVTGSMKNYKKMESTNLSTLPALISLKDKPQKEKLEEKRDSDKKFWVPDEHVQYCYNCGSKFFSLINRKHHCRVCGNIFCKSCIESFCEITIFEEKKELKVCSYCQEKKGELNTILKNNLVEYRDEEGNKIFETKTWDYAKNKKKIQNEIDKFCGFNNIENTSMKEFHENINKNYETLLERMVYKVLSENSDKEKFPNLAKEWGSIIFKLIKTVIDNLSPSFQELNDSIDINDCIKIKTIEYKDQSKCEVIDGYAMQRNVCSKKMRTDIKNPKILLLKGSLDGFRMGRGNKGSETLIVKSSAVEDYIEIIRKKIEEISPQIIIVENNASQKFQNFFTVDKMNISLIIKCPIKKLNRIARCVNSFVVPSPDLIGKQVVLGSCSQFKVQTFKSTKGKTNDENTILIRNLEYNLMRFEGCGKVLFNTIILSGPNYKELRELKKLMHIIAKNARFLFCQKFLLKYFNMLYEPFLSCQEEDSNKKNIKRIRKKSTFKSLNYLYGFDTEILDEKLNEFECIFMSMNCKNRNELLNINLRNSIATVSEIDRNSVSNISPKESQILKSVPNQCSAFSLTMNAYSTLESEEITLGNNIFSLLEDSKKKCEKCGDLKSNHISYYYKNNGRIKISILNLEDNLNLIDKVAEFLSFDENSQNKEKEKDNINKKIGENNLSDEEEIYSYGYCEKCFKIVTPIVKLPNEILNFSATKFYQNILYNKKLINFGDNKKNILNFFFQKTNLDIDEGNNDVAYICQKQNHFHYKDISRIFVTKDGAVKFQYEDVIKYKLLGSQLNAKDEYYKSYHKAEKIKEIALDKNLTLNALDSIKNKFTCHKNMLVDLKSENFNSHIEKLNKIIDDGFAKIEELIKINSQLFSNEADYENIFIYYCHLKIYLIKIMNIKIISNHLLRAIKYLLKVIFFEEIEESNKIIKEQELKVIDSSEKNGGDSMVNDSKLLTNSINSFTRPTLLDKNKFEIEKNSSNEERAKSQGLIKESKNEENNNNNSLDNNEQVLNNENNKTNISNKSNTANNSSNSTENNLENSKNNSDNSKTENNNNESDNNNIISDEKLDNTNKDNNNNDISNNLNIMNEMKSGKVIVDLDEIDICDSNSDSRRNSIKKSKTNYKTLKKIGFDKFSDKDIYKDENISLFDKELSDEEKSNSKLIDLSIKRTSLSLSQIISSPELKEQINSKYEKYFNEIDNYISNILELDKNDNILTIIEKLNFYDKKHTYYSNLINEEDICSIITYALTSDQYLDSVKIDKNGLNEIKSEFINNEINIDEDNDLFCHTSLLYDRDKIKFSLGNFTEEKITQILENELLSNVNKKCVLNVTYDPSIVFNEVFEKKKKKENKNINSKINYLNINQGLYTMFQEIKNIKNNLQKAIKERFDDFNKRFSFTSVGTFEEEKVNPKELKITAFYVKHFEALRILYCASYFEFLQSIMKSQEWSSVTGGKSKAHFFKSWDERFVVKCLSEMEFKMFIESCYHYFVHNNKYFFFKMPSSLVKVVGAYKIKIKSSKKNVIYCVIMENLNYLLSPEKYNIVTYDLKGSSINRYVKEKETGRVLMDTNFLEDFCGEPLALDQKIYTLLLVSLSNDTKICKTMGVIDYSLLCVIVDINDDNNDENNDKDHENNIIFDKRKKEENVKYIRLGVLDYFRKYTWDKQLETLSKTIINKFNAPTVINPKKYDERFIKKLRSYFLGI